MFKNRKNIDKITFLIKISLFLFVLWLFINQINKLDVESFSNFSIVHSYFLFIAIGFIFLNLGLEFLKWKLILTTVQTSLSNKNQFYAYLAGIVTGFVTPNMLGNFIGRMFYFKRSERPMIVALTLFSNASQFLASMFFGVISIWILDFSAFKFLFHTELLIFISVIGIILFSFLFFFGEKINFWFISKKAWFKRMKIVLKNNKSFRLKLLFLSLSRHFVFSLQFYFLLLCFGVESDFSLIFWIWNVYFWSTLIPSLWFGKLLIRESMSMWILGTITGQTAIVLLVSVVLWCINQFIPAMIGIPFVKSLRKSEI